MKLSSIHLCARPASARSLLRFSVISLCLGLGAGCGGNDPAATDGGGQIGGSQDPCPEGFLPLKVGVKWTYLVHDVSSGDTEMKVTTVEAEEAVPKVSGVTAFKMVTRKGTALGDETVSYQKRVDGKLVRYQEQAYKPGVAGAAPTATDLEWWDPYKLRLDETAAHLKQGVSWQVSYNESLSNNGAAPTVRARNETWTVVAVNEMLTVRYGTRSTLHVHREGTDQGADSKKDYWFACGVGKLKETGGQTEELQALDGL